MMEAICDHCGKREEAAALHSGHKWRPPLSWLPVSNPGRQPLQACCKSCHRILTKRVLHERYKASAR